MKIGIIQPNYIPWRGYFDFIREVDTFVFLDDVQYTPRDWRNRNKIKLANGSTQWLSVPVTGGRNQRICDVGIDNTQSWAKKHFAALQQSYGKTPYFKTYSPALKEYFEHGRFALLSDLTIELTETLARWLDIDTPLVRSSTLHVEGSKDDRLLAIVQALGGDTYLSGPAARDYIRPDLWREANVKLAWKSYEGYPEYPQISEPFEPQVSIVDLLFMMGPAAKDYIAGPDNLAV